MHVLYGCMAVLFLQGCILHMTVIYFIFFRYYNNYMLIMPETEVKLGLLMIITILLDHNTGKIIYQHEKNYFSTTSTF